MIRIGILSELKDPQDNLIFFGKINAMGLIAETPAGNFFAMAQRISPAPAGKDGARPIAGAELRPLESLESVQKIHAPDFHGFALENQVRQGKKPEVKLAPAPFEDHQLAPGLKRGREEAELAVQPKPDVKELPGNDVLRMELKRASDQPDNAGRLSQADGLEM